MKTRSGGAYIDEGDRGVELISTSVMHPDSHNDPPQREENSEAPADVSRGEQEPGTSEDPVVITDHRYDEKFETSKDSKQFGTVLDVDYEKFSNKSETESNRSRSRSPVRKMTREDAKKLKDKLKKEMEKEMRIKLREMTAELVSDLESPSEYENSKSKKDKKKESSFKDKK